MSKLKSLSDALDGIEDGATIGIGGWIFNSQPMALVRELIRRDKRSSSSDLRRIFAARPRPGASGFTSLTARPSQGVCAQRPATCPTA
jgi:hypothetical protein